MRQHRASVGSTGVVNLVSPICSGPPDRSGFATSVDPTNAGKLVRRHPEESVEFCESYADMRK